MKLGADEHEIECLPCCEFPLHGTSLHSSDVVDGVEDVAAGLLGEELEARGCDAFGDVEGFSLRGGGVERQGEEAAEEEGDRSAGCARGWAGSHCIGKQRTVAGRALRDFGEFAEC